MQWLDYRRANPIPEEQPPTRLSLVGGILNDVLELLV